MRPVLLALLTSVCFLGATVSLYSSLPTPRRSTSQPLNTNFARDPQQAVDKDYTERIHKYTTDPAFTSPLVDYLPASKAVPTPAKVLGDVYLVRPTCFLMLKTYTNISACSPPPVRK